MRKRRMVTLSLVVSVFFFSSRRRHTRSLCDWSSDVCSSDLFKEEYRPREHRKTQIDSRGIQRICCCIELPAEVCVCIKRRSEERRVGKECRSRGWPDQ